MTPIPAVPAASRRFALAVAIVASLAPAGCGGRPAAESSPVPVAISILPASSTIAAGVPERLLVSVENRSAAILRWPDMNDPRAWQVGIVPADASGSALTCHARVGDADGATVQPLELAPGATATLTLWLPGRWGGWSRTEHHPDGTFSVRAAEGPEPRSYRIELLYAPTHAARPELQSLPGWGSRAAPMVVEVVHAP